MGGEETRKATGQGEVKRDLHGNNRRGIFLPVGGTLWGDPPNKDCMTLMTAHLKTCIMDTVRALRSERGDVLLEYVLLTILIVLPLVGASTYIYNPTGKTFNVEGAISGEEFGVLGDSFVKLYRMVMSGVSLPLP